MGHDNKATGCEVINRVHNAPENVNKLLLQEGAASES
jgi:hypothetical protein